MGPGLPMIPNRGRTQIGWASLLDRARPKQLSPSLFKNRVVEKMKLVTELLLRVPKGHRLHNLVVKVINKFSEELKTVKAQLGDALETKEHLNVRVSELVEQFRVIEEDLNQHKDQADTEKISKEQIQEEFKEVEALYQKIKDENLILTKELKSRKDEVDRLRRNVSSLANFKSTLEEDKSNLTNRVNGYEKTTTQMQLEFDRVNNLKNQLENDNNELNEEIREKVRKYKSLLDESDRNHRAKVENYEEERRVLVIENERLKKVEINHLQNKISMFSKKEKLYQEHIANLKEEIDSHREDMKKIGRLYQEVKMAEVEKKEFEKEAQNLRIQMKQKDEYHNIIQTELNRLNKRLGKVERNGGFQKTRIDRVHGTLGKMNEILQGFFTSGIKDDEEEDDLDDELDDEEVSDE